MKKTFSKNLVKWAQPGQEPYTHVLSHFQESQTWSKPGQNLVTTRSEDEKWGKSYDLSRIFVFWA